MKHMEQIKESQWRVRFATRSGEPSWAAHDGYPADRGEAVATFATKAEAHVHAALAMSRGYLRAWPEELLSPSKLGDTVDVPEELLK